eukprot:Gregarina_sp_Pseudo_9__1996@NODE_2383_length_1014_cov_3_215385_g2195_i0_p4_GENE_NODE_2383_length_1014_cov_3_215385_g2195_i0NODE_2383_length_1014_cov_3_215385_g2195_i0_p4_ORF_typecomplete_len114_score55_97_NODE_2383_length_1014_cov_3_215385_g2195_i0218559
MEKQQEEEVARRVGQCCSFWLETLSREAAAKPASSGRSQIEALAASVSSPLLAEEAIASLLKTAILQSLLLARLAARPAVSPYSNAVSSVHGGKASSAVGRRRGSGGSCWKSE